MSDLKTFITKTDEILLTTQLDQWYNVNVKQPILKKIETFQEKKSNWKFNLIQKIEVNINKYNHMRASSYIDLPPAIKRKEACINVQNGDQQCFKWAILSALKPVTKNADRVSKYVHYEDELNFMGIEFPVSVKDISKFEVQNPNIYVKVYGLSKRNENFNVYPLHLTVQKRINHINLLRVKDHYIDESVSEEEKEELQIMSFNYHYLWIKDLSRLVDSQLSKKKNKKYIRDRYLHYFGDELKLTEHEENCRKITKIRNAYPLSFTQIVKVY